MALETLETAEAVVERVVELVEDADSELGIALPAGTLAAVREPLQSAFEDGVLVLLLVSGYDPFDPEDLDGLATVARHWDGHAPLTCAIDSERGLFAPGPFIAGERADRPATAFDDPALSHALFGGFVGNFWLSGSEVHTAEPAPLGRSYAHFRHAVVQATLRLRDRERVRARIVGRPVTGTDTETVEGLVVNARQSFVYPVTSSFPAEVGISVRTDDGLVSVGGWGSFVENYEAERVTLEAP